MVDICRQQLRDTNECIYLVGLVELRKREEAKSGTVVSKVEDNKGVFYIASSLLFAQIESTSSLIEQIGQQHL